MSKQYHPLGLMLINQMYQTMIEVLRQLLPKTRKMKQWTIKSKGARVLFIEYWIISAQCMEREWATKRIKQVLHHSVSFPRVIYRLRCEVIMEAWMFAQTGLLTAYTHKTIVFSIHLESYSVAAMTQLSNAGTLSSIVAGMPLHKTTELACTLNMQIWESLTKVKAIRHQFKTNFVHLPNK